MTGISPAATAIVLGLIFACGPAAAQEKSVKPGINDSYRDPDVAEFTQRFEREGREAYDHRKQILAACRLKPGMVVADIGAGTGLFTLPFARKVGPTGKVFAVDIAETFIRHIEKKAREAGLKNVVGVVCAADDVKLPPASIDFAFICDTYHHFEYPKKTLASIHRALKPGGRMIVIDFHRIPGKTRQWTLDHVRAGQETFTKEIVSTGFRKAGEEKFLKENYFLRFEKVERRRSK